MNRLEAVGAVMIVLGVLGYAVGVVVQYPGRAFSVTAIMVGITLVAIRRAGNGGGTVTSTGDGGRG